MADKVPQHRPLSMLKETDGSTKIYIMLPKGAKEGTYLTHKMGEVFEWKPDGQTFPEAIVLEDVGEGEFTFVLVAPQALPQPVA